MALRELPMSVGRLVPRHPLWQIITLRRKPKITLVRMYIIASEYDSSFLSAILLASCFIVRVADRPAPPVTSLDVKYCLLIFQVLLRIIIFVRFCVHFCVFMRSWVRRPYALSSCSRGAHAVREAAYFVS